MNDLLKICRFFNKLGRFYVSGGEVAAFVLLDSLIRRLPGVLGNKESGIHDSFMGGMLQYPHYTKPDVFESMEVPAILKSGITKPYSCGEGKKLLIRRFSLVQT